MKRRQFVKGAVAVAALAATGSVTGRTQTTTVSWWRKYSGEYNAISDLRFENPRPMMKVDFGKIEERVLAYLNDNGFQTHDGEWHQYAANSDREMFFDGKQV